MSADLSLRFPLDAAPDAMLVVDQGGEIIAANTQAERLFGHNREQLIGKSFEWLIPSTTRDLHLPDRENDFHDPRTRPMRAGLHLSALRSDGTDIPVHINLSPLTTDSGTFVVAAIRDATEFRRAEEPRDAEVLLRETRESEERFRLMSDVAPVLIWMSGPDTLCTYFNKPWLDFTGRSLNQEKGNGWTEGVHPDDRQSCLDIYGHAFDRREEFRMEYRLRRHDGEYRWIYDVGVPRLNADGSFAGYIGSCVDVTERKRAEQAARESDELLRLAAHCGRMFAYEWDAATDVLVRSGESSDILGIDGSTPIAGQQVLAKVHPEDRDGLLTAIAALSPARYRLQISYRMIRPDGRVIWVDRNSRAYFDERGSLLKIIGMVADVTSRRLAEEALLKVDAKLIEVLEEERTRIARELHDDISQRLALLAVQLDHMRHGLPTSAADLKRGIGEARKQTVELGKDIQALSHRLYSSKLLRRGVVAAAQSLCRDFSEQHQVEIDFTHRDVPPSVSENISLCLFRVLQEAMRNAVKHSGVRQFAVELRGSADAIDLTVRDAGLGFDPAKIVEHRGLGLLSMRERVDLAGGTFSIDSSPGRGTKIHVRVPLQPGGDVLEAAG
jgi:PAS domain S-box-containing protein